MTIAQMLEDRVMACTPDQRRQVLSAAYQRPCAVVDDHSARFNVRHLCQLAGDAVRAHGDVRLRLRPGCYQRSLTRLNAALRELENPQPQPAQEQQT